MKHTFTRNQLNSKSVLQGRTMSESRLDIIVLIREIWAQKMSEALLSVTTCGLEVNLASFDSNLRTLYCPDGSQDNSLSIQPSW